MLPRPHGNFPRLQLFTSGGLRAVPPFPGCYRIIHVTTGRVYVGASYHLAKRFLEHQQQLRRREHPNRWLQRAYDRSGPGAFRFQVLEIYHGRWRKDCLSPAEQRWINLHTKVFNVRPAGSDEYLRGVRPLAKDLLGRPKRWVGGKRQVVGGPRQSPAGLRRRPVGLQRRPGRAFGAPDDAD